MSSESRGVGDSTSVSDLVVQERSQASRGLTAENAKLPTFCSRYFRARKRMHCPCCGTGSMPTHSLCLSPSPGSFKVRPSRISILLFLPPLEFPYYTGNFAGCCRLGGPVVEYSLCSNLRFWSAVGAILHGSRMDQPWARTRS